MGRLFYCIVLTGLLLVSCGNTEESISIVEARQRAEVAATKVIECDSTANLMNLQNCILHAKSVQSEYLLLGDTAAADTFDAVFRRYVKQCNPQLADEMFVKSTASAHNKRRR